ncbi:unnamed protein product [Pleuronectes platessa]|uniref:Uncharacterized protein n=1 Tax=Pleuronectes platessa TaxID=8262 RepID=A0A9N7VWR9_PLEPL|nr:unnamed protein product [Pleuronectes platessa]
MANGTGPQGALRWRTVTDRFHTPAPSWPPFEVGPSAVCEDQVKEEEFQTAGGLTLRGQRSWEAVGQYENERSMPLLDKPEPHVSGSQRLMERGGVAGECEEVKIKSCKVEQRR